MSDEKTGISAIGDFVTIGNVKADVKLWGKVNSYKSRERQKGRKLKMRDALCELADIGAKKEGITA